MPEQTPADPNERVPVVRMTVVALLLALSCATLIGSVVPARDGLYRTEGMLDAQAAENERLEKRLGELAVEEDALRHDEWVNDRILRSYQFRDPGEIIVRPSAPSDERPR